MFSGLAFNYTTSSLLPFTTYNFQVEAVNSAGSVFSASSTATTNEDAPSFVPPPYFVTVSASSISITWQAPPQPNGVIVSYQLFRDGDEVFNGLSLSHMDTGLEPFTSYNYHVQACTNGGCTNSSVAMNTTLEDLPEQFSAPIVSAIQARSLTITWSAPAVPNGVILYYTLSLGNGTVLFNGTSLTAQVTGLSPFTNYSFFVTACNGAGCTQTSLTTQATDEAVPEGVSNPGVRDLSTTSVEITWSQPTSPNGIITNYTIRRDGDVIFQGLQFEYVDTDLEGDVLYSYTVEAVNSAGGTASPETVIRTRVGIPEGLAAPVLTVLNSTAILARWSAPTKANGEIFNYTLHVNEMELFMALQFNYTITGLSPFTSYSIFVEACNQAGCASSTAVTNMTDPALPAGVLPPSLTPLGPNLVGVSWMAPSQPNGIISNYFVFRRQPPAPVPLIIFQSTSPMSFNSTGLTAFTTYEFRVEVRNQVGSTSSEFASVVTLEGLPAGISSPIFPAASIFATNVTALWTPPTQPNGVITSYQLHYRIPLDPLTNAPGTPILAATVPGNVTTVLVTGLSPFTSYEFRIVAINGAGEGTSEWELVTTGEARPEGINPITVEMKTAETLVLQWTPPDTPNGVIMEYRLYLDGELVYHNSLTSYTVMRLDPFTSYTLLLSVCTSAGCTSGMPQTVTTSEAVPANQQAPVLAILTPYALNVRWQTPQMPNGIITRYDVLRVVGTSAPSVGNITNALILNSTMDVSQREFNDTTVLPATSYHYAIRSANSAGETVSPFQFILTPEAAPEGIPTPSLTVLTSTEIRISWTAPTMPNGDIIMYRLFREDPNNNVTLVYTGLNPMFVDSGLLPFTSYAYFLEACTGGGCANGTMATGRTDEAIPEGLAPPILTALSANNISIRWMPPQTPNGIITQYIVDIQFTVGNQQPVIRIVTSALTTPVTNLPTYTIINVTLQACTSAGCVPSEPSYVRTLEAIPKGIQPPVLVVLGASSIQASWNQPLQPNGIILQYVLRRNSTVVYEGPGLSFLDTGLLPFQFYAYDVQANNSAGYGDRSGTAIVRTLADTPTNISAPSLLPLSPTSIRATWVQPSIPNGAAILEYRLYIDNQRIFQGNGATFLYLVTGLDIFTTYQFLLEACTSTCANSSLSTAQTLPDPPQGQTPPVLVAQPNATVAITWSPPANPNGIITNYTLERRLITSTGPTSSIEVFTGLAMSYVDQDTSLVPALQYEYRVEAINIRGSSTSAYSSVILLEEAPEGIAAPQLVQRTATNATISLPPPSTPNGNITQFMVFQNQQLLVSLSPTGSTLTYTAINLDPFSLYLFYMSVCTSAGCTAGPVLSVRTDEAAPVNLPPPVASAVMFRSMVISWGPPVNPNGNLTR